MSSSSNIGPTINPQERGTGNTETLVDINGQASLPHHDKEKATVFQYTDEQRIVIQDVAKKMREAFPPSETEYWERKETLKAALDKFTRPLGFRTSIVGFQFQCRRAGAPTDKNQSKVPPERGKEDFSVRCGCNFRIRYAKASGRIKGAPPGAIRITNYSHYYHTNGCFPSQEQLSMVENNAGRERQVGQANQPPPTQADEDNKDKPTFQYTDEQRKVIQDVAKKMREAFPPSATEYWASRDVLKEAVDKASQSLGFMVSTEGNNIFFRCSRGGVYEKKQSKVPPEKRRRRLSSRCGCSFRIRAVAASGINGAPPGAVRITDSSCYVHSNGCFPSQEQLMIDKKTLGKFTRDLKPNQLEEIARLIMRGMRPSSSEMRSLMRPLYPASVEITNADACNLRVRIESMIKKGVWKELAMGDGKLRASVTASNPRTPLDAAFSTTDKSSSLRPSEYHRDTQPQHHDQQPFQWETITQGMHTRRYAASAAAFKNKFLVFGGYNGKNFLSTSEMVDLDTQTRKCLPSMPTARFSCAAVAITNHFYVIGGGANGDRTLGTMEMLDLETEQWSSCPSMLMSRQGCAAVAIRNQQIIVMGGYREDAGYLKSVEMYNAITKKWMALPSMPRACYGCSAAVAGDYVYVFGGAGAEVMVQILNLRTFGWSTLAPMPFCRENSAAVAVGGKQIVLVGGSDGSNVALDSVDMFDIETRSWTKLPPMIAKRDHCVAAIAHHHDQNGSHVIIVAGGRNDGDESYYGLTSVEGLVMDAILPPEVPRVPSVSSNAHVDKHQHKVALLQWMETVAANKRRYLDKTERMKNAFDIERAKLEEEYRAEKEEFEKKWRKRFREVGKKGDELVKQVKRIRTDWENGVEHRIKDAKRELDGLVGCSTSSELDNSSPAGK